ncbi:MAG: TIGR03118 family protein [Sylvanvirus sp.]|uniref:TIGR03118 family protein n=1 Tax=Sylvanvirus sp. TaxID=2487774 RepID=A0A3G5AH50_9VIRU|nr:MAG: TIGR03118 family protein [Sylvanvirus sp.]
MSITIHAREQDLFSDVGKEAKNQNANTINPWGIALSNGFVYVANNGSGTVSQFDGTGTMLLSEFVVPSNPVGTAGNPTGIVANNGSGFIITNTTTGASGPSKLILCTEDGQILGFNSAVDRLNAIPLVVSDPAVAVYKGLALLNDTFLYVCNFRSGFLEQYDTTSTLLQTFTDTNLTTIGYAPFNVIVNNQNLLVTFAQQDDELHDDVAGLGNGYIDVFRSSGQLVRRFFNRGPLNSPWGMLTFKLKKGISCSCKKETHGHTFLLVGNFGGGDILIFNLESGVFIGRVLDPSNNILTIDHVWGLLKLNNQQVLFAAGIDAEAHGLYGILDLKVRC